MRYGSVCSGIEAATQAWHPLGWQPAFFSEIEAFPSAVLAHHYGSNMPGEALSSNGVPNLGDMTKFEEWPDYAIDLLVGGTPCQSFSVAGLRQGLADPRGNLMLTYLAIARRYQPRWLVWENVPGVLSSNGGRDFGTFIRGLEECGYHASWRVLDAQYVRVDGFERAVPQRRRRVFVVGYLGDWRRAAAVLLEREGMRWDSAPSRKAGKGTAGAVGERAGGREWPARVASTLNAAFGSKLGLEDQHINEGAPLFVAHSLRAEGFDASEDGTGRGTPIVPVVAASLTRGAESAGKGGYAGRRQEDDTNLVAFNAKMGGSPSMGLGVNADGTAYTLDHDGNSTAIAFDTTQITSAANYSNPKPGDPCHPLASGAHPPAIATDWAVRRLTPTECERLQGFSDNFTAIPHRGKPAADGPRYKALGNSMACNVMRWIGRRIEMIEQLTKEIAA